jgi:sugar phosphate isomerase/epimerase
MLLGYNTNGLAHHRLRDAIPFLVAEGYQSVALTLDAGHLDPYDDPLTLDRQVAETVHLLDRHGLARVVETGARYLLNPARKHDPTLVDPDPARRAVRQDFLRRSIDLASQIGAPVVSIWSGIVPDGTPTDIAFERLAEGLRETLRYAESRGVTIAFEPEPGMFVDTFAAFARLEEQVRHPLLQLTVDIGHVHCLEDGPVSAYLRAWGPRIVNVHIEDMRRGVHDHLMFGDGTIDFVDVFSGLRAIGYDGGLHVELSRHSHAAVEAVRGSAAFLRTFLNEGP